MCGGGGEPFVIPYVNLFAIAHTPPGSFSNNLQTIKNAPPRVGWIRAKNCTKDVTGRKVTCFEDPGKKGSWICEDSPSLLCQHGYIKSLQVSEAQTPFKLRVAHLFPTNPSHFCLLMLLALGELKAAHGVGGDRLGNRLNKDFLSTHREQFTLPTS